MHDNQEWEEERLVQSRGLAPGSRHFLHINGMTSKATAPGYVLSGPLAGHQEDEEGKRVETQGGAAAGRIMEESAYPVVRSRER